MAPKAAKKAPKQKSTKKKATKKKGVKRVMGSIPCTKNGKPNAHAYYDGKHCGRPAPRGKKPAKKVNKAGVVSYRWVKVKTAKKTTKRKTATGAKRKTATGAKRKPAAKRAAKPAATPKAAAKAIATVVRASKKGGARARPVDQFDEPPMYAPYDLGRAGGYYDAPVDPRYAGAGYDDFEPRYAGAAGYAPLYTADPRMAGAAYGADPYYGAAPAGYYPQEPVSPRFAGAGAYGYDEYDGARYGGAAADMYDGPAYGGADPYAAYAPDMGGAGSHHVRGYTRSDGVRVKGHTARNPVHHHKKHAPKRAAPKRRAPKRH